MSLVHVVTSPCIGVKDTACAKVCPVSCFFDAGEMLVINPGECIGCGLCVPECPVAAIYPLEDVPVNDADFAQRNADFFSGRSAAELEALRVLA